MGEGRLPHQTPRRMGKVGDTVQETDLKRPTGMN